MTWPVDRRVRRSLHLEWMSLTSDAMRLLGQLRSIRHALNGPELTSAVRYDATTRLRQTGHSCDVQHLELAKGRIVGKKRLLKPKHVWAIRVRLELTENHRDLALFNLAIDSKLRGFDLVRMKVVDVVASGDIKERASVLQSKTQKPVRF